MDLIRSQFIEIARLFGGITNLFSNKMKRYIIFLFILLWGCGSPKSLSDFVKNRTYIFSDNNIRKLEIIFKNDTLIEIRNEVGGLHYSQFGFKVNYYIKRIDFWKYRVEKKVNSEHLNFKETYIHPYRKGKFIDYKDIFPNITSDTIFLDLHYNKLIIKDFCFEYHK